MAAKGAKVSLASFPMQNSMQKFIFMKPTEVYASYTLFGSSVKEDVEKHPI